MSNIKKLQFFAAIFLSFFFSTGFFGGDSPEDAVKDIYTALENNDSKLFISRVPKEYWMSLTPVLDKKNFEGISNFAEVILNKRENRSVYSDFARNRDSEKAKQNFLNQNQIIFSELVSSGEMANFARSASMPSITFAPEFLEDLEYKDIDNGKGNKVVATSITLQSGQKSSLAFIEIEDKWLLLGQGGNNKAAADLAVANKTSIYSKIKELEERNKRISDLKDLIGKQYEDIIKLVKDGKEKKAAENFTTIFHLMNTDDFDTISFDTTDSPISLNSPEVWNSIERFMMQHDKIYTPEALAEFQSSVESDLSENKMFVDSISTISQTSELLWKDKNYAIAKTTDSSIFAESAEEKEALKNIWLESNTTPDNYYVIYSLYRKENDFWVIKSFVAEIYEKGRLDRVNYISPSFSFQPKFTFTAEEFITELAKRYSALEKSAKLTAENEEKWKKEISTSLESINKAITDNNKEELLKYIDLVNINADNGDIEETAQNIVEYKTTLDEHLKDIKNIELLGTFNIDYKNLQELRSIVSVNGDYILLTRDNPNSHWKAIRQASFAKGLERPADWDEKIAKRVAELEEIARIEAEKKEEILSKVTPIITANIKNLTQAVQDKNIEEFSKYVDVDALVWNITDSAKVVEELTQRVASTITFISNFNDAITSGKPISRYADFWDKTLWSAPKIELVGSDDSIISVTIASKAEKKYTLFAKNADTYTLIALASDKSSFDSNATSFSEVWQNTIKNFTPNSDQQELIELVTALKEKNGDKAVEFIDFNTLTSWNYNDYYGNSEQEAFYTLFPNDSPNNKADKSSAAYKMSNSISDDGAFFGLTVYELEQAKYIKLDSNLFILRYIDDLFFFKSENNTVKLKTYLKNVEKYSVDSFIRNYPNTYKTRADIVKGSLERLEKRYASRSVSKKMVDFAKVESAEYSLVQGNGRFELKVKLTIRNTFTSPIIADDFFFYFQDKNGNNWNDNVFYSGNNIEIAPNKAIIIEKQLSLNKETVYLFDKVKKGEMLFFVEPYKVVFGNLYFRRFNESEDIKKVGENTWQYANFPSAKVINDWKAVSRTENDAFLESVKADITKNSQASIPYVNKIFQGINNKFDKSTGTLSITNPYPNDIYVRYQVELLDSNDIILESGRINEYIEANATINYDFNSYGSTKKLLPAENQKLSIVLEEVDFRNMNLKKDQPYSHGGVVFPQLFQESPVLFTLTKAQAESFEIVQPVEKLTQEEPKKEEAKEEKAPKNKEEIAEPKTEASVITSSEDSEAKTESVEETNTKKEEAPINENLVAPEAKKPGVAIFMAYEKDSLTLNAFTPDTKNDSAIQILAKSASPLIAIKVETVGGTAGSWKTKDVKSSAIGVLLAQVDGKDINPSDSSFELDITNPTLINLILQDSANALTDKKNRVRITLFHKDGSRLYSVVK